MTAAFFSSRLARSLALTLLLLLGFGIRALDLTDLPLDFHPTRQLLSALKARGMYYEALKDAPPAQRDFAIQERKSLASLEPEFFERLVAFTYRFTGERLWVARVYSSLFWVIGAAFLYLLAREFVSEDGALAATAVYLFLPYSVIASRSFQPDPLMVMLIIVFWFLVMRWSRRPSSYPLALAAGLFGGLAILIKFVAVFFVIGGGIGAALGIGYIRETARRPQVWAMTLLGILPGAAYVVYGVFIAQYLGQRFGGRFIPALLLGPSYYLGWMNMIKNVTGFPALTLGLLGLFFLREKIGLRFLSGLWAGYAFFGFYFNYHISSHDYYSLALIPILALSLAPLADSLFAKLSLARRWLVYCVLFFGLSGVCVNLRADLMAVNYRPQAAMWAEIGVAMGDKSAAGLTQDYGSRLAYWGWRNVAVWPNSNDLTYHETLLGAQGDFESRFNKISSKELFLVTDFEELNRQPLLKEKLSTYPIFAQGEGYVIYELNK